MKKTPKKYLDELSKRNQKVHNNLKIWFLVWDGKKAKFFKRKLHSEELSFKNTHK